MLSELKIEKRTPLRSQISESLRDAIMREKILAGTRLPTTREMAKQWDTPLANVHAALAPLVKEGLLIRKQGVGTIVNTLDRKLETIAIYITHDLRNPSSVFQRLLLGYLEKVLIADKIECRVIFENMEKNGFAHLKALAETRQVQGVIIPATDRYQLPELKKLPIPYACLTSSSIKNRVVINTSGMMDKLVEAVKQQGGKSLGIISTQTDELDPRESGEIERHDYYVKMFAALKNAGIENRPEWNYIPYKTDENQEKTKWTHFAYEAFNKVWENKVKPDCLFVYPDDLIVGTVLSATMHNIKIPDELKLIMHRNSGNDVLCPLPCHFIENNVRDMAQGLIQLVKDQFNGKNINEIELDYILVKHQPKKETKK